MDAELEYMFDVDSYVAEVGADLYAETILDDESDDA